MRRKPFRTLAEQLHPLGRGSPLPTAETRKRSESERRTRGGDLERKEEEFPEAIDGSEEDVFGHGVTWDEDENVVREEKERIQPPLNSRHLRG